MDGDELSDKGLGLGREGKYGVVGGEIHEVGTRSGWGDTKTYDKREATKGEDEGQGRKTWKYVYNMRRGYRREGGVWRN